MSAIATPADLHAALLPLDPGGPIHRALEADLADGRPSRAWYCCQQEHLLGWLGQYDGPSAYGRANPNRSARFVYNAFQCAPGLAWIAEAAGGRPGAGGGRMRRGAGGRLSLRRAVRGLPARGAVGDGRAGAHGSRVTSA